MKKLALALPGTALLVLLVGCIPKVSLTVETRDPQGTVIDRATVTNSDVNGRDFRVNSNGSVVLTAAAQDSSGLQALDIGGGFSCNKIVGGIGQTQQGTLSMSDPSLPGQHPASSSFTQQFQVQCIGGMYRATVSACATGAKGRSCTKDATLK